MRKAIFVAFILVLVSSFLIPAVLLRDAKASWKVCTPLTEPTYERGGTIVYNEYDGYWYKLGGKDIGTATWTDVFFQRYDFDADTWTTLTAADQGVYYYDNDGTYNKLDGSVYFFHHSDNTYQQYNGSWHDLAGTANLADGAMVHNVAQGKLYNFEDNGTWFVESHDPLWSVGGWTAGIMSTGWSRPQDYRPEVTVGTTTYYFHRLGDTGSPDYVVYTEGSPESISKLSYGAAWSYVCWVTWYDASSSTIYGVWSPQGEDREPKNAHLCTFNTATRIWTEGSNLGLAAYSGMIDTANTGLYHGHYEDGYAYILGTDWNYTTEWTSGSPFFKFPVPGTFVISETNTPSSVTFNGLESNTTYYAKEVAPNNPVVDGDCTFTVTNNSGCPIDLDIKSTEYSGGNGWTLTTGVPGDDQLRITAYYSGQALSEGLVVTVLDQTFIENLDVSSSLKWDFKVELGTIVDDANKTGTITLTGSEYPG